MLSTNYRNNRFTFLWVAKNFYGHLGLQLHEFSLQEYRSIVRLFANITIAFATLYGEYVLDCFSISHWQSLIKGKKLFFSLLIKLVYNYGFGFCSIIRLTFYLFGGRRVARAIDCAHLRDAAARHLSARANTILIIAAFGGVNLYSFFSFYVYYSTFDNLKSPIIVLVECLAIYVNIVLWFFEFNLLLYFQWLCLRALTDIETDLRRKYLKLLNYESKAMEQIKTLASINRELNSAISFPLMIYMLLNIADLIIIVCFLIVQVQLNNQELMTDFLNLSSVISYLVYIVNLNHRCRSTILRIRSQLCDFADDRTPFCINARNSQRYALHSQNFYQKSLVGRNDKSYHLISIPKTKTIKAKTMITRTNYPDAKQQHSRIIRAHEIDQYFDSFQLRIFHLTSLNFSVLLTYMLSIFNYVIFIVQTN